MQSAVHTGPRAPSTSPRNCMHMYDLFPVSNCYSVHARCTIFRCVKRVPRRGADENVTCNQTRPEEGDVHSLPHFISFALLLDRSGTQPNIKAWSVSGRFIPCMCKMWLRAISFPGHLWILVPLIYEQLGTMIWARRMGLSRMCWFFFFVTSKIWYFSCYNNSCHLAALIEVL
jgi:hypothetical protein